MPRGNKTGPQGQDSGTGRGIWDPAVEIAGEAAVMAQAREETVFVQTVEKESLIN